MAVVIYALLAGVFAAALYAHYRGTLPATLAALRRGKTK